MSKDNMLVHESGHGLKSVITDKDRSFLVIKIKPHDIYEELNLVKTNNIYFRKFIYSKTNFQPELIHIQHTQVSLSFGRNLQTLRSSV